MQFILVRLGSHGARTASRGRDRATRRACIAFGADGELSPSDNAGSAIGTAAQAGGDALEVSRVCDLLGEAGGEGDELVDLKRGDVVGIDGAVNEEGVVGKGGGTRGDGFEAGEGAQVPNDGAEGLQSRHHDGWWQRRRDGDVDGEVALDPHCQLWDEVAGVVGDS